MIYIDSTCLNLGTSVKPTHKVKLLGVHLDATLSMKHAVMDTCKSCRFKFKKYNQIARYLNEDQKIILVKSMILSKIDYCNILQLNANKGLILKTTSKYLQFFCAIHI